MASNNEDIEKAFIRLQQSLHSYLHRRLPDSALADDLLQDIFLKSLVSQQAGKQINNMTGWLYSVTRTTLIDYYRSKGIPTEEIDENVSNDDNDELLVLKELSSCLRPFIKTLPTIYRDTLIATELEGKTMREFAESQCISVSAIKSRAARGRVMLKQKLLSCCHIEIAEGAIVDYYSKPISSCSEKCA